MTTSPADALSHATPADGSALTFDCVREFRPVAPSQRVAQVSMAFGLSPLATPRRVLGPIELELRPGQIVLFLGPSGSGKSSALLELEARLPLSRNVQRASLPFDRGLVDSISPYGELSEALSVLSACGLGEAPLWLRRYDELSEGEKFRARLAKVIGLEAERPGLSCVDGADGRSVPHPDRSTSSRAGAGRPRQPAHPDGLTPPLSPLGNGGIPAPILCDEFCAGLHRRAATAVAYNLRKLVTRRKLCVVAATCDESLVTDLQPDVIVRLQPGGRHDLERRAPRPRAISLWSRLAIEPGSKTDYVAFASMHYREADELGFVDKVFVLRERGSGERLGIVVYAHPPLELALRNRATDRRFCRNPALLNREMRILRRLVIHPDVRGCGLGRRLVEKTLPRVGAAYVECLASMGEVHPVFERAGMRRIGSCPLPVEQSIALAELKAMDVDPFSPEFAVIACRSPRVRQIVADAVRRWYRATSGEGARRVANQSPRFLARLFRGLIGSRPVYYLWQKRAARGAQ